MVNRVQTQRFSTAGSRPAAGSRAPGELYINWPDMQLGVIDGSQNPNDLIAVRFFSPNTSYNAGDLAVQGGHMWHANQAIPPGPFNPAQWDQNTTSSSGNFLPITGGTMTGALTLAADPTGPLGAATKQYADKMVPLAGGTMTGNLTLSTGNLTVSSGSLSVPGSATFGSVTTATLNITGSVTTAAIVSNSGGVQSHGSALGGFYAYDRGNAGGNTADYVGIYRDANLGRLSMTEFGDVLTMSSAGAATFLGILHVNGAVTFATTAAIGTSLAVGTTIVANGNITSSGSLAATNGSVSSQGASAFLQAYDRGNSGGNTSQSTALFRDANTGYLWMSEVGGVMGWTTAGNVVAYHNVTVNGVTQCNALNVAGVLAAAPANTHYPVQISASAGYNAAFYITPAGQDSWLVGPMATIAANTYYIYDNSVGGVAASFTSTVNYFGHQTYMGGNGLWTNAAALVVAPSTSAGAGTAGIAVYDAVSGGQCIWNVVGSTSPVFEYFSYGVSKGVGSISTDGNQCYYNTFCDVRLKDNVRPLSDEIDVGALIDSLKPVAFEWKPVEAMSLERRDEHGKVVEPARDISLPARTAHGFVAQDLYEVVPDIVRHEPNEMWMADASKLIPYLVAEIQDLRARLAKVEGK